MGRNCSTAIRSRTTTTEAAEAAAPPEKFIHDGYAYYREYKTNQNSDDDDGIRHYRCTLYKHYKCLARIRVMPDGQVIITSSNKQAQHIHARFTAAANYRRRRKIAKTLLRETILPQPLPAVVAASATTPVAVQHRRQITPTKLVIAKKLRKTDEIRKKKNTTYSLSSSSMFRPTAATTVSAAEIENEENFDDPDVDDITFWSTSSSSARVIKKKRLQPVDTSVACTPSPIITPRRTTNSAIGSSRLVSFVQTEELRARLQPLLSSHQHYAVKTLEINTTTELACSSSVCIVSTGGSKEATSHDNLSAKKTTPVRHAKIRNNCRGIAEHFMRLRRRCAVSNTTTAHPQQQTNDINITTEQQQQQQQQSPESDQLLLNNNPSLEKNQQESFSSTNTPSSSAAAAASSSSNITRLRHRMHRVNYSQVRPKKRNGTVGIFNSAKSVGSSEFPKTKRKLAESSPSPTTTTISPVIVFDNIIHVKSNNKKAAVSKVSTTTENSPPSDVYDAVAAAATQQNSFPELPALPLTPLPPLSSPALSILSNSSLNSSLISFSVKSIQTKKKRQRHHTSPITTSAVVHAVQQPKPVTNDDDDDDDDTELLLVILNHSIAGGITLEGDDNAVDNNMYSQVQARLACDTECNPPYHKETCESSAAALLNAASTTADADAAANIESLLKLPSSALVIEDAVQEVEEEEEEAMSASRLARIKLEKTRRRGRKPAANARIDDADDEENGASSSCMDILISDDEFEFRY